MKHIIIYSYFKIIQYSVFKINRHNSKHNTWRTANNSIQKNLLFSVRQAIFNPIKLKNH